MIHTQAKRYQIVLWLTSDRRGPEPALRMDFDTVEQARAEFEGHKGGGVYRSGILMEFRKISEEWALLDMFS